ncbi:MAG: hydrogenase nickel incorporation protein HypB [Candidatus Marinimicrobia bacterium]|nr:hydrogenase nickel incorporation protein HypB [Candidatus Neomarinimicrobiota bacterium]
MKIEILKNVLEVNDNLANDIREKSDKSKTLVLNMMSSPGSGKTSILEKLLPKLLFNGIKTGIIEGDITTTRDADRIIGNEIPVVQINTEKFGGDCHLGSEVVKPALDQLHYEKLDLVIIENVGNLVCPAEFDTGADKNIVVISVTEGEDKPLKYPLMFRVCELSVINKVDLLPFLNFDMEQLTANIRQINPNMEIIKISAQTDENVDALLKWIQNNLKN